MMQRKIPDTFIILLDIVYYFFASWVETSCEFIYWSIVRDCQDLF